jgi:hypothetical protein
MQENTLLMQENILLMQENILSVSNGDNIFYNVLVEITDIIKTNIKLLKSYNISKIIYQNIDIYSLLNYLLALIKTTINIYKYEDFTELFEFIVKIINKLKKKKFIIIDLTKVDLLNKLSLLNKGQLFLENLKEIIIKNNLSDTYLKTLLYNVCTRGTLPIYIFWRKLLKRS